MSKYLTKSVAATISALLLLGCAAPAFAADATVEKKETSYLILNADGSVQEQVTSDWLHSDDGFDAVTDESDLSDIQNLKSDVMPEQSGNTLKWTTDETDIYYQGIKNSAQAPVGVSIEYTLDGKTVTADELKGQSGHLVATVKLTNNTGEEVTVNGKKRTVYTPFFTVAAAVLPSENFKNITTEHGLVESDSKTQVACYLAMPGMKEAVSDLLPDSFDKLDDLMLDTLTLEADVTDCTVPTFLFAAAPNLSDLDLDEASDELGDTMNELTDAIDQLKDGSGALDDAVGTLVESLDTFASSYSQFDAGVDSALNGTQTLANGTENLLENAQLLATKTGELSLGAIQLQNSTAQLAGVMNQQLVPGLVDASEKKTALEDKMTELSGKLETVEIPDMTALKAQLGAGAAQVFDGAASGAAKAASEAAASNAATVASQKTAEEIKGNVQAAADDAAVGADQVAALSTDVFQGGYKTALEELLSDPNFLTEDQKNAILAKIDVPASPSSEITDTVTAKLSDAATVAVKTAMGQVVNDIDSDTIASTVGPKVAEQVAPAVTEKVTTSEELAAAKQSAVQQVAAAIPDINTDELKSLMGEFKDLSSQAGEMMDSVDTLTGALYNAENPADTNTVVGAANAISDGAAKLGSGASQLATGTSAFATGVGTLDAGTNQLLSGMETLSSSSKTVSNAIGQFQTGGAELKDGTSELSDGMTEFSGTINDKLDGLSEITDPDSTLARVIDIMKDRADSFKGSGRADGTDMTVSYVMRTATDSSSNSTSTTEETTTETETKDSFWNRVANLFSK